MATVGDIVVNLTANTRRFQGDMQSAAATVSGFASSLGSTLAGVLGIGSALSAATFGVRLAAQAETATVAFTTMLKSATAAKALVADIQAFAAATPFETTELVAASRSLAAFGIEADQIIPNLRVLGDLAAGIGAPIGELAELFGKAKVQGRLFAQDVNQLTNRGIPVIQEFAKQFGVSADQVRGLVESGKIGFPELQRALISLTSNGGQFAGLMAEQSKTLTGLWSTLKDVGGILSRTVAEAINPGLKEMAKGLSNALEPSEGLAKTFKAIGAIGGEVAAIFSRYSRTLVTLIGLLVAIKTASVAYAAAQRLVAAGLALVQGLSGPAGWAALAVGITVATVAIADIIDTFDALEAKVGDVANVALPKVQNAMAQVEKTTKAAGDRLRISFGDPARDMWRAYTDEMLAVKDETDILTGSITEAELAGRKFFREHFGTAHAFEPLERLRDDIVRQRSALADVRAAAALEEELKTPQERAIDKFISAQNLFDSGKISEELLSRAFDRFIKDLGPGDGLKTAEEDPLDLGGAARGTPALLKGSRDAFSAIQAAIRQGNNQPINKLVTNSGIANQLIDKVVQNTGITAASLRDIEVFD